jgi:predicted CXXCH cytochrome family protein
MRVELCLCWLLLVGSALLFVRGARGLPRRTLGLVLLLGAAWALGLALWGSRLQQTASFQAKVRGALPSRDRVEFVSSDTCQACHPSQYDSWHHSFHRTMTQIADANSVKGKFQGVTLVTPDADYHLSQSGDQFAVEIFEQSGAGAANRNLPFAAASQKTFALRANVAMLTGSHRQQVYWASTRLGNMQAAIPFAYLLDDQRWVPNSAIFLRDPAFGPMEPVWNDICIECHATGGQPRPNGHSESFATRVGELGIACESCHGPGLEHVRANHNPARRYQLHLGAKPDPTIVNPARLPSKLVSQVCGQCHGVIWIPSSRDWKENGFHYRPGDDMEKTTPLVKVALRDSQPWMKELLRQDPAYLQNRFWSDGMVRVSGREFNGLVESPCYKRGDLTCLSCHSMHHSDPDAQVTQSKESNESCLQCHKSFRDKLEQHTHHLAGSTGSLCYNCHMPYTTYGLLKAIRSHQIDSPSVAKTQATGRPNACNLCHLDRSLGWTAGYLAKWYQQPLPKLNEEEQTLSSAVTMLLRGDAGQRALIAWSMGWPPARKTSGEEWLAPYLGQLLEDPYPAVRYIAGRSLRRLPEFKDLTCDFIGSPNQCAAAHQQALAIWQQGKSLQPAPARRQLLMGPNLSLDQKTFHRLLRQRDDHPMDLRE